MPLENESDATSTGKESPVTEISQSREPVDEVRESSTDPAQQAVEEPSDDRPKTPADCAESDNVSEEFVCPKCGGIKRRKELEPLPEDRFICRCDPGQEETQEEDKPHGKVQEKDAGACETGEIESPVALEESSLVTSPEQDLSSETAQDTSGSTTSDSAHEKFILFTCVRQPPPPSESRLPRSRGCPPLDDVRAVENIPGQATVRIEGVNGGDDNPSAPRVTIHGSNVQNQQSSESRRISVSPMSYKSVFRVIGCVIIFVFFVILALLFSAQITLNRRQENGNDSSGTPGNDTMDRNSTASGH